MGTSYPPVPPLPPPPAFSPDGQFWWDGQRWMPANKKRRWRLTDWLLPVILVGLGVGSWIAASNSRGFFGEATTTSLGYTVIGWALISAGVSWLIARRT